MVENYPFSLKSLFRFFAPGFGEGAPVEASYRGCYCYE